MSRWRRLLRGESNFDFVGNRRRYLAISAGLVLVSLISLAFRQLNLGIDFRGGLAVQAENPAGADVAEIRDAIAAVVAADAKIQLVNDGEAVRIQTGFLVAADERRFVEAVAGVTGSPSAEVSLDAVGPTFGAIIARRALLALGVFLGAVVLYMTWRLEWKMALAGLVALGHDLVLTVGVYSITGFEVTPATVVAILTILGYSLYDTVVVFDKVDELAAERREEMTYTGIANRAMNMVLMRSLNTSLTSLLPVGSLLFVGALLLGAASLRDFALALFVGIAAGTYSSIFVAGPLLADWKEGEEEWSRRRRKLSAHAESTSTVPIPAVTDKPPPVRRPAVSGAAPRPPKRRRK